MTQIATPTISPAVAQIRDHLDAIGQKYRLQRLLRGLLLLVLTVAVTTALAVALAHFVGAGMGAKAILAGWSTVVIIATLWWFVRPLLFRPDPVSIAHLVESQIGGLHNGFTNALLLSTRTDLADSPWLPQIYDEILRTAERQPLRSAVRMADLRPLLLRVSVTLVALAIIALLFRAAFSHGWQQLFNPTLFVPQNGAVELVSVQPGHAQLVLGKPLELTVVAHGPASLQQPALKVIFDRSADDTGEVLPIPASADVLPATVEPLADPSQRAFRYVYKLDRLDRSLRYRVELAGTQSAWFSATVIRQVVLQDLYLKITPPTYTGQASSTLKILAADVGKTPVVAPEGSDIELAASIDVPVEGAVLQLGDAAEIAKAGNTAALINVAAPLPMTASQGNRRFSASFTLLRDTPIVILLTDSRGQAMFRVPEGRLVIEAKKDLPPTIEMKWPTQDVTLPPTSPLQVRAMVRDDRGLAGGRVLVSIEPPANGLPATVPANDALRPVATQSFALGVTQGEITSTIDIPAAARVAGTIVRVQVEATDNRDLGPAAADALKRLRADREVSKSAGPQTTRSAVFQIRLQEADQTSQQERQSADALRKLLLELLATQKKLHATTLSTEVEDRTSLGTIADGQSGFGNRLKQIADTFVFQPDDRVVQKTLLMLAIDPAKQAVDVAQMLRTEPAAGERRRMSAELLTFQRRIISTLESLLAVLNRSAEPTTQPAEKRGGDLATRGEELKKLDAALKAFIQQQQKLLDQTAPLAKKPVDSFDDADKKLLEDLKLAQEKLDAFMQEKVHDFSRQAEHDMANTSILKDLMEIYSEVAMAKDALKAKAMEVAVAVEENGLELAKELSTNLEKWLSNVPDRTKWLQEDLLTKTDVPMAELPKELTDIVGELLEQEEDLFEELEDQNANLHDSIDKGSGWDAMDGPISNMSAKGVTGNQLPNNNEMSGRSGEGRSGKSQGEMVEETASGKGGRRTPTRLDPTAFQQGQVKDESKDPTGGATGGGKISGQGGQGLEGPVPPGRQEQMQRLAQKQAQLRNAAERLNLQYQLGRYDNFKLLESIALMRRVEADLNANRYQTAMRRKDILLDRMETSRLLVGAEVHVKQDTTPTGQNKQRKEVGDAMKGELPEAWKESLKQYYEKLANE